MQSLTHSSNCYCHINFNKNSISEQFCVDGSSILRFDTTFEIIEGFWLTDKSYINLSIIDESGNHTEFPGPNVVYFWKGFIDYNRLATEMTFANENLYEIKQVGSDMDPEIFNEIGLVFSPSKKSVCMQNVMERDIYKSDKLKATLPHKNSILIAI